MDEKVSEDFEFKNISIDELEQMYVPKLLSELVVYVEKKKLAGAKNVEKLDRLIEVIRQVQGYFPLLGFVQFKHAFRIGVLFGRFVEGFERDYTEEELVELLTARASELRRQSPIRAKHRAQKGMREQCQLFAEEAWREPRYERLRLGDMCQVVWSMAHDWLTGAEQEFAQDGEMLRIIANFRGALPDKADGLKSWLRPVAPESASRRGQPKKVI